MEKGVFTAQKKDGTLYFRSNITYHNKHISLGSFSNESQATLAYEQAKAILSGQEVTIQNIHLYKGVLQFEKVVSLCNFRDNQIYIKTPIYLHSNYFSYFLSKHEEYKFDIEDLFLYSNHKIMKRGGYLFVSEFGMQTNLLTRYGIRNFSVKNRDFFFVNDDFFDFRYSNIMVINPYYGVQKLQTIRSTKYVVYIHINGQFKIGEYKSPEIAAIAYNKAVDLAIKYGVKKNFPENYVSSITSKEYAKEYVEVKISRKYIHFLKSFEKEDITNL